jgi:hypothetical protein
VRLGLGLERCDCSVARRLTSDTELASICPRLRFPLRLSMRQHPMPAQMLMPHPILRSSNAFRFLPAILLALGCDSTSAPNPTPGIGSLTPEQIEQGSPEQIITVAGTDFVPGSVVRVNGSDRTTDFVDGTELRATLPESDFATAGTRQVVVFNPAPGGGTSNSATLTIQIRTNPVPAITSISPTFANAGSTSATVTITGTGFVPTSRVFIGNTEKTGTAFVSATQIQVTFTQSELATGATHAIRVLNPFPGGGFSNAVNFEVRTPIPMLTSLGTPQGTAGIPEMTLRITGTGFVGNSKARFSGAERPTTFVSATTLDVLLGEGDLRAAGTFQITVVNPAPGGGTSNALDFVLVNGVPTLELLPSSGGHAGRPGFTLFVHGRGFVQGATVHWNGSARPSQYISGTRITAEISSSDVASAGTAQITVVNPAPAGGTSASLPFVVRSVPVTTATSATTVRLEGNDLAWDSPTNRLYLSIRSTAALDANSIVAVDPTTGTITGRVFVGSNPSRIERTRDGQYLYVGLNGASAVRRVTISPLTAGLQWSLLAAGEVAAEIKAIPFSPRSVVVTRQRPGYSPPLEGVTVYDDGIPRPQSAPGHTGANRLEVLDSPSTMYGYNNAHTGFEFFTLGVDASGIRHLNATGGLIGGFYTHIVGAAARIYGTDGSIVDAERRVKIGSFPAGSFALLPEPATGRAFMLVEGAIAVYDLNNFQLLGTVPVANINLDHPALIFPRLVRWGSDGIAFLDFDDLFAVRSPIFAP